MYPDLTDAIVLTGFSMNSSFQPYSLTEANLQQAQSKEDDSSQYPPGYLVSSNINANQYLFFSTPYFDRDILTFAEQNKKPVTVGELMTTGSVPMQSSFTGPVLIITGSNDLPFCGGDCLNMGHGINMHYNSTGHMIILRGFWGVMGLALRMDVPLFPHWVILKIV